MTNPRTGAPRAAQVGQHSGQRLTLLTAAIALAALTAQLVLPLHQPLVAHAPWPLWVLIGAGFLLSHTTDLHLRIGKGTSTLSVSEVPLIAGLALLSPAALLAVRLVGSLPPFVLRYRQPLPKLAFNLALFWLEVVASSVVWQLLRGQAQLIEPRGWLAVLGTCLVSSLLGGLLVSIAAGLLNGHLDRAALTTDLAADVLTALGNGTFVLVGAFILGADLRASWIMVGLAGVLLFAYRAYLALQRRTSGLEHVAEFSRSVGTELQADSVALSVVVQIASVLRAETVELVLAPDAADVRRLLTLRGAPPTVDDGADGTLAAALLPGDWDRNPVLAVQRTRDGALRSGLASIGAKDAMVAALQHEGTLLGTLLVADRVGDSTTFDRQDRTLLETLANHASVALRNGRLADQLRSEVAQKQYQASHDALTGLPNRTTFRAYLAEQTASGQRLAVLLMDLDRFKEVNDTLGHSTGDQLLVEFASRLRDALAGQAMVARLGGDEFVVAVLGADVSHAIRLAETIRHLLGRPVSVEDLAIEVQASIGIAVCPQHGDDPAVLLRRADIAMYAAKASHAGFEVYAANSDENTPRRFALVSELRRAIESGQLVNLYQPKVALEGGRVVGVEALVRWDHPSHGLIVPDEFIPIAEQTGLIRALTLVVLRDALRQCAKWRAQGLGLSVAVNLSARSLLDQSIVEDVLALLDEYELPSRLLTLEITESSMMADPVRTISLLRRLSATGVELAVDDFGTGYSSLAYLKRLPVDEIKIDKSFVQTIVEDASDSAIVAAVVELSHRLGKRVVAEGVEDRLAFAQLGQLGCDEAQGFWLSRPLAAADVGPWVAQWHAVQQSASAIRLPAASHTRA